MSLNKIITEVMTEDERKSWQPTEQILYAVGIKRSTGSGFLAERWFWQTFRERSDLYPQGLMREDVRALAGKTGRIYKHTVKSERIQ